MRLTLLATLVALNFSLAPALAYSAPPVKPDLREFPSAKAQIEKDLEEGKRYSELTRTQREDLIAALERIENALAGIGSVSELRDAEKAKLMTDQEFVNALLTKAADDSRLTCRQERKTGSHRPAVRCATLARVKRDQEEAREVGRRFQKSYMRDPSAGPGRRPGN